MNSVNINKLGTGGIAAAANAIVLYLVAQDPPIIPETVGAAIIVIITFVAGYFVPPKTT